MNWTLVNHLLYLAACLPVIAWVGRVLARNGQVFLADVFADKTVATATNRLLIVGFYLLNLGFVLLYLRVGGDADDAVGVVESLSVRVGVVLLVTGLLHVINVKVFTGVRRRHVVDGRRLRAYEAQLDAWAAAQRAAGAGVPAPR